MAGSWLQVPSHFLVHAPGYGWLFGAGPNKMYFGHEKEFKTRDQLKTALEEYIAYYNKERIQIKLGYLSPLIFREKVA